jgi:hypothetical protein
MTCDRCERERIACHRRCYCGAKWAEMVIVSPVDFSIGGANAPSENRCTATTPSAHQSSDEGVDSTVPPLPAAKQSEADRIAGGISGEDLPSLQARVLSR